MSNLKPLPAERITYQVNPGQEKEVAELQTTGQNRGKYKDLKTGQFFDNNQEWIRSKKF